MVEAVSHEQETRHVKRAATKGDCSMPGWNGSRGKVPRMMGNREIERQGRHQPNKLVRPR